MNQTHKFRIENDTLTGPADYMAERGNAVVDEILSGKRPTFDLFLTYSPTPETALCVYLQTDYASWLGEKSLTRALESK